VNRLGHLTPFRHRTLTPLAIFETLDSAPESGPELGSRLDAERGQTAAPKHRLVEARVIDLDGVYNPCRPNDRLLLGMKGSISEFELGVLRARMLDAARSKAGRGELRISVPFGYIWHREVGLGLDPDQRLQEVIRLIFAQFRMLGSARQVLLSMTVDGIHFPRPSDEGRMTSFEWRPIRYRNVIAILKNPFYAGVYVYGKSEKRTALVDGRARRSYGQSKPIGTWEV
jgi:Recombinase